MSTLQGRARRTGLVYLVMSVVGATALLLLPGYIVHGDAAATAQRIAEGAATYRLLLLSALVGSILFAVLGWSFYNLFEQVDRKQSLLLLALVLVSATIGIIDVVLLSAPIVLYDHAAWFAAMPKPQLDALGLVILQLRSVEVRVDEMLWGVWLIPLGILSIRSGFIPKLVGWAVLLAAAGWMMQSAGYIAFPSYASVTDRVGGLLSQLELIMILWLLIKGARERRDQVQSSESSAARPRGVAIPATQRDVERQTVNAES